MYYYIVKLHGTFFAEFNAQGRGLCRGAGMVEVCLAKPDNRKACLPKGLTDGRFKTPYSLNQALTPGFKARAYLFTQTSRTKLDSIS
jgi:hypothetical protein